MTLIAVLAASWFFWLFLASYFKEWVFLVCWTEADCTAFGFDSSFNNGFGYIFYLNRKGCDLCCEELKVVVFLSEAV